MKHYLGSNFTLAQPLDICMRRWIAGPRFHSSQISHVKVTDLIVFKKS